MRKLLPIAVAVMMATMTLISCNKDDVNLPLVMGAPVTIDVRSDGATLQFNIDGNQQTVNTATITATPTPVATRMWLAGKIE